MFRDIGKGDWLVSEKVPGPTRMSEAINDCVESDLGRESEATSYITLSTTKNRRVDGEHDGGKACVACTIEHRFHDAAVSPHIHLEPLCGSRRRTNFFDASGREGGQRVRQIQPCGGTCHSEFTLGCGNASESCGSEDEWHVICRAQDRGCRVDVGYINQDPGSKFDAFEVRRVTAIGDLIVRSAVEVIENAPRQATLRNEAKVEDVGRLGQPSFLSRQHGFLETDDRPDGTKDPHVNASQTQLNSCGAKPSTVERIILRCWG